jgi:phage replication O-like protein O
MDNYTKFPNEILEALMRYRLPGRRHLAVMLYIARMTYGWNKNRDYISIFKMASELGMKQPAASGIVSDLAKMGLIEIERVKHGRPSMIRITSPKYWEQPISSAGYPTQEISPTEDMYLSPTGDTHLSPTGYNNLSSTGDTPNKEIHIKDSSKESVFSSSEDDDEWLTIDELRERRRANGETDL